MWASEPENGGMYYMVLALLMLIIYFEFLLPDLSDADNKYLRNWAKAEFTLVFVLPLAILAAQMTLVFISFGSAQFNGILTDVILFLAAWYSQGLFLMDPDVATSTGANFDTICKAIRRGYIIWKMALTFIICAFTGTRTFAFLYRNAQSEYVFPVQEKLLKDPSMIQVNMNGDEVFVDLSRGYLTYFLNYHVPSWLYFILMFYLSHLYLTATFRCIMYYTIFLIDMIAKAYKWIFG